MWSWKVEIDVYVSVQFRAYFWLRFCAVFYSAFLFVMTLDVIPKASMAFDVLSGVIIWIFCDFNDARCDCQGLNDA